MTSAAAILSLALAIGACTAAFRLVDALFLRPLPVAAPERLYALSRQGAGPDGKPHTLDGWEYSLFRQMRAAVKGQAELLAISYIDRMDLTYQSDQEMEKAYVQYVSGWMFGSFGLRPVVGRLFTENDDLQPGAHPYAVLSHDYWARRFGRDPKVIGCTFRMGNELYEIVGVGPERFTGTEPGTVTDIFLPTMMNAAITHTGWNVFRTFAHLQPGVATEPVRDRLRASFRAFNEQRAKAFTGRRLPFGDRSLSETLFLEPAAAGVSGVQETYRLSLVALGVLVALVLLIACANVANLMTAQAASRGVSWRCEFRSAPGEGVWCN